MSAKSDTWLPYFTYLKKNDISCKIYEKPKVSIRIIKNAKSFNTNNQKCKKQQQKQHLVPAPRSPFARKAGLRLGLLFLLRLSGLVCLLLFIFVLVLAFCSVEHALDFRFVASSLALVFISLSCVCLHTLVWIHVRAYLIFAFSHFGIHLAFVLFC